jgi:hypothetical protein
MPVMLQVRNLPDEVHKRLKERAAEERMSLSDYVARELAELVEYRSNAEIMADFRRRHPELSTRFKPGVGAETVRAVRDEREAELEARYRERHPAP